MTSKKVKSFCRECERDTNQDVLSEHTKSYRDEYFCDYLYQIVQCRGCETISFREVLHDLEASYPINNDKWVTPEDVTIYPKVIEGHTKIEDITELPFIVRKIYFEIILALKENAKILAGLGLRTAVEAVCNDLEVSGRNLEARINKLATIGYISKRDAERLHGIRFMGNDAAHDIKTPKDESLIVALQIVEHLLSSVYILEKKASGKIDTTISNYKLFEGLLEKKLADFNVGDEFPIAMFLGKDLRRVKESITLLERELMTKITNGSYSKLSIGKVDHFQKSPEKLQHFIVENS